MSCVAACVPPCIRNREWASPFDKTLETFGATTAQVGRHGPNLAEVGPSPSLADDGPQVLDIGPKLVERGPKWVEQNPNEVVVGSSSSGYIPQIPAQPCQVVLVAPMLVQVRALWGRTRIALPPPPLRTLGSFRGPC